MRALTLTQPWCGLVASGIKRIENRPRSIIRRENVGKPFALHASREIDESVYNRIDRIWPRCGMYMGDNDATCPELICRLRDGHDGLCDNVDGESDDREWMRLSRITSAVIAVATIDKVFEGWDAKTIAKHAGALSYSNGSPLGPEQVRWFFGPIGYVLRDVCALATPVPCRGWQGFWTLPAAVERAVAAQIARAA